MIAGVLAVVGVIALGLVVGAVLGVLVIIYNSVTFPTEWKGGGW